MDRRRARIERQIATGALAVLNCLVALASRGCASPEPRIASSTASEVAVGSDVGTQVQIFDGQTLDGWIRRGGEADYRVEHGEIVGETRPNQPNTFLCTTRDFSDFILEFDFQIDPQLNSGVQVRSHARAEESIERVFGYQIEIDPSERSWTAGFYDESRRGWLALPSPEAQHAFQQHEWNHLRIRAKRAELNTWLNGVPAATLADGFDSSGFIALQVHGVGSRTAPLVVKWRNIRLWRLSAGD